MAPESDQHAPDEQPTGFPEPPGRDPDDHSADPDPHHALNTPVGEPDPIRTEIVKAVIVLKEGYAPTQQMAEQLQEHVRARLAAHEYPRIVEFAKELPLTATGKIIRRALRSPRK